MLVTSSDVASIDALLNWWESAEYFAEAFVILSCVGEFVAEFTSIRTEEWPHKFGKVSLLLLIAALGVELGALVRTNSLSGQEIAVLNGVAADARRDASKSIGRASQADERASKNEREAASLRKRAEDEAMARAKIEEAVAWRRLTKKQISELGSSLAIFPRQLTALVYNNADVEAFGFATDIDVALHEFAKWNIGEPQPIIEMREGPARFGTNAPLERGVVVRSSSDQRSVAAAKGVIHELISLGFDATQGPPITDSRIMVEIFVQPRPEGPQGTAKLRSR